MFFRTLALTIVSALLLVPTGAPAQAAPDNFSPRQGVTFNNPLGDFSDRRAIYRKIIRAINSSPRKSKIKMFTWNFLTNDGKDALLRAQKRGVIVRVLMDDRNTTEIDNKPWARLKRGLRQGNDGRPKHRRSWARLCDHSCRGSSGSAHSKFFMFSEAGKSRRVVIQGSANFTLASTNNQWNDVYTHEGNRKVWRFANRIFNEASKDKKASPVYSTLDRPSFSLMMFPNTGKNTPDPVAKLLNKVRCFQASNTKSGRTVIRIAPDVIRHERGMALARKVRDLWDGGCDVKIGYTVMGVKQGRMLRDKGGRGPVPMKHLVQDFNGDGEFDNYFHLKSMVVRGHIKKDHSGWVTLNGSANWSGLAAVSDENVGIYWKRGLTKRYQQHLEYWYENFPASSKGGESQLVFGAGRKAVYEDGTPVTDGTVNPFARVDSD